MHENIKPDASVATDLDSGSRMSPTASFTTTEAASHSTPTFQHSVSLPSPPCSPKQTPLTGVTATAPARSSPLGSMLQAPASVSTAKLDISLLLKSSPSPPPSSGHEAPRSHNSRASSVPPPTTQHFETAGSQHRPSASSSAAPSGPYHTPHDPRIFSQPQIPAQQSRPVLPPLATSAIQPAGPGPQSQTSSHLSGSSPQQHLPSPLRQQSKRAAPTSPHPAASPAKRQSKWTPEEDALIIELRGSGMKWEEISKRLPGRSAISCRLHYQNYLERRSEWDEERKNRLARLYERLKPEMWGQLAAELGIPWRAAEAMHWQLGETDMARRAGVVPFSLATSTAGPSGASASAAKPPPPHSGLPTSSLQHSVHPSSALPPARYGRLPEDMPLAPAGPGPYAAHSAHAPLPPGRLARSASFGARLEDPALHHGLQPPAGLPPMTSQAQGQGQGMLPSLSELERGITAFDDRPRPGEVPQGRPGSRHPHGMYPGGPQDPRR